MNVEGTSVRRTKSHRVGRDENRKTKPVTLATQGGKERSRRKGSKYERGRKTMTRTRKRKPEGDHVRREDDPNVKGSQHVIGDQEGILKQSIGGLLQEHKEKEEEVLPRSQRLATLNTGKLYVQTRDEHFKATKVLAPGNVRKEQILSPSPLESRTAEANDERRHMPITFAIILQRFLDTVGFISRGFLAGMALTHFLMIHVVFSDSAKVALHPVDFSRISELYSNLFSCLLAFCLTSVLDKILVTMPPSSRDYCLGEQVAAIRGKTLLTLPFYLIGLILQLLSAQIEQAIITGPSHQARDLMADTADAVTTQPDEEFDRWQRIVKLKDLAAILAWLLECFDIQPDTFLLSLKTMAKGAG